MPRSTKIGILGGGLTGLTIATNLKSDCEILEKTKKWKVNFKK